MSGHLFGLICRERIIVRAKWVHESVSAREYGRGRMRLAFKRGQYVLRLKGRFLFRENQ